MKIIDMERKGLLLRLHLGVDDLDTWWGDDWNDTPYDCNAGVVYDRFVSETMDIVLPWDTAVLEPSDIGLNCGWSRDDMRHRLVPMLLVSSDDGFAYWDRLIADEDTVRVYMGDPPETLTALPGARVVGTHTMGE